jgi:hypothetical protein
MTSQTPTPARPATGGLLTTVAAPIGFLGIYLAASPVSDALADRAMPLPTAPATEAAAYFAANPAAVTVLAGMQVLSVACFAVFVAAVTPLLRDGGRGAARLRLIGYLSVAAMVVSSLLAGAAALVASSTAAETVDLLRQASFYAGGVVNIVTLGGFVYAASLWLGSAGRLGKPSRGFGYTSGVLAMASVASVVFYYASILLPAGRVLCMVWTVVAGLRLARGARQR